MNLFLFILIGAGCGWISAGPLSGNKGGNVVGSVAAGAIGGLVIGLVVSFVFGFLFFIAKLASVVFGVFILLAVLGFGDSD